MRISPNPYPSATVSTDDWFVIWRTLCFDLPLAFAARFDAGAERIAAAPGRKPPEAGGLDASAALPAREGRGSSSAAEIGAQSLGCGDFAPEALDEIASSVA